MQNIKEMISLDWNKLILIGGKPATGKTELALNIVKDIALNDKTPVVLFSLETSIKECVNKIIGNNKSIKHIGELADANIFIDDTPKISINEIKEKCVKLKREKNIGLVIIDYLQLIQTDENIDIVNVLKEIIRKLNVSVIVTSQLSSEIDKRNDKRPTMQDLKQSKSVADVADSVLFLYNEDGKRKIIIAKNNI